MIADSTSMSSRFRRTLAGAALLVSAALVLTGCSQELTLSSTKQQLNTDVAYLVKQVPAAETAKVINVQNKPDGKSGQVAGCSATTSEWVDGKVVLLKSSLDAQKFLDGLKKTVEAKGWTTTWAKNPAGSVQKLVINNGEYQYWTNYFTTTKGIANTGSTAAIQFLGFGACFPNANVKK